MRTSPSLFVALLATALLPLLPLSAAAQSQDYFIPGQQKPPAPRQAPSGHQAQQQAPAASGTVAGGSPLGMAPGAAEPAPAPPANVDLPPPPELPPLAKGEPPPGAIIGVLGVPEVMRASTAAQEVEKVIGGRRNKLNEDAQKEQQAWRDMQQSLANDRAKLSQDQIRARERALQERITNAQRIFRERNRVIQEAAQYALAQIERTLVQVIRQVAESRGMNLVLHRQQVALNINQFDITDQVAAQLNKVLPSVIIPPDGVSPSAMASAAKKDPTKPAEATAAPPAAAAAPHATPAAAPPVAPKPAQ